MRTSLRSKVKVIIGRLDSGVSRLTKLVARIPSILHRKNSLIWTV